MQKNLQKWSSYISGGFVRLRNCGDFIRSSLFWILLKSGAGGRRLPISWEVAGAFISRRKVYMTLILRSHVTFCSEKTRINITVRGRVKRMIWINVQLFFHCYRSVLPLGNHFSRTFLCKGNPISRQNKYRRQKYAWQTVVAYQPGWYFALVIKYPHSTIHTVETQNARTLYTVKRVI